MRARWGRWHGYMDEIEEAMRVAGQHLAEVERLLAAVYERTTWKGAKRDSADGFDAPYLVSHDYDNQMALFLDAIGDQGARPSFEVLAGERAARIGAARVAAAVAYEKALKG